MEAFVLRVKWENRIICKFNMTNGLQVREGDVED